MFVFIMFVLCVYLSFFVFTICLSYLSATPGLHYKIPVFSDPAPGKS